MDLQQDSVQQPPCAGLSTTPTLPFISPLAGFVGQGLKLAQGYCLERSVSEIIVEGCIAALVVAVIYFGHPLLLGLAALWCLTMVAVAVFRLSVSTQAAKTEPVDVDISEDVATSNAYIAELSESLT